MPQGKVVLAVAAIIEDDQGRLLMVREANPDYYGLWNQPAGHVDPGETIEAALLREVAEETGYLHARIEGISKIYYFVDSSLLRINYKASLLDFERGPLADDVLEAGWFSRQELLDFIHEKRLRSFRTELAIRDWIAGPVADPAFIQTVTLS
jgi:8-oxo-dGTP diphosphatase